MSQKCWSSPLLRSKKKFEAMTLTSMVMVNHSPISASSHQPTNPPTHPSRSRRAGRLPRRPSVASMPTEGARCHYWVGAPQDCKSPDRHGVPYCWRLLNNYLYNQVHTVPPDVCGLISQVFDDAHGHFPQNRPYQNREVTELQKQIPRTWRDDGQFSYIKLIPSAHRSRKTHFEVVSVETHQCSGHEEQWDDCPEQSRWAAFPVKIRPFFFGLLTFFCRITNN